MQDSNRIGKGKPGPGRPKGSKNKRTIELQRRMEEAEAILQDQLENCSDLDAHATLMAIYKDMNNPVSLRLEAARAAAPFEKPKLVARHSTDGTTSPEEWLGGIGGNRVAVYIPDNGRDSDQPHIIESKKLALSNPIGGKTSDKVSEDNVLTSSGYGGSKAYGNTVETMDERITAFPKIRTV